MTITKRDSKGRILPGSGLKHGLSSSPEYDCWVNMRARCNKKHHPMYKYYGARGITVCDRWNKFDNFISDMGLRPDGMTLDRVDVNGGYEPSNCRWVSHAQQQRNRRDNTSWPGVVYEANRQKYRADITVHGKKHFLGRYTALEDAIAARKQAEFDYGV